MTLGPVVHELPAVVAPEGEPPEDIGTGHPMRAVTERVAADPSSWTAELAAQVGGFFDERAGEWAAQRSDRSEVLVDALDRGLPAPSAPVVELGAGTGAGTRVLAERCDHVVAGDLAAAMLANLPPQLADRVRLDGSRLPFADRSIGTLVCVNMLLFADEVRRVLAEDGALVWVNSIGERTPIHLGADAVAAALGDGFDLTASRCGWGTWAVARRSARRPLGDPVA
jgi:SAM-dependent methyltransferase